MVNKRCAIIATAIGESDCVLCRLHKRITFKCFCSTLFDLSLELYFGKTAKQLSRIQELNLLAIHSVRLSKFYN